MANGAATALGIGIQNVPEGLAVAVSLASVGYGRLFSFVAAFMTGLVEPVGGFLGISAVTASSALLPWGLGFRSREHTSELQSLMRISYAVFCLKKKNHITYHKIILQQDNTK